MGATNVAYVFTFMATMLEIARADGVLASAAEFLWVETIGSMFVVRVERSRASNLFG